MRPYKVFGLVGVLLLAGSLTLKADVWDVGGQTDNVLAQTDNVLRHGSQQIHDLATQGGGTHDKDYFRHNAYPYSSWVAQIDGVTSDINFGNQNALSRRNPADEVLQVSEVGGPNLAMFWFNNTDQIVNSFVLVDGALTGCAAAPCDANDQYRITVFDTTIVIPRFNNGGTQTTILLIQNSSQVSLSYNAYAWSNAGALLHTITAGLAPHQTAVINLGTIPQLQAQAGSMTLANNGQYGVLVAKAIALEPATGFSFDSPGIYRPY